MKKIEISQNAIAIKNSWGAQSVVTSATATITEEDGHSETYEIEFVRNQITGSISRIESKQREEETTTEFTLTDEAVCDLCRDELEN